MAHNYTPEERAFIEQNYLGIKTPDLTDMFNAHFGTNLKRDQIKSYLSNHKLSNGVVCRFSKGHVPANKGKKMSADVYTRISATMFKKGNIPVNHKPVGSERIDSRDGYHLVKVAEPNKWRMKHVLLWEQHNGSVPKGYKIAFVNQNKDDIRIDNLLLVSAAQMAVVNKRQLLNSNSELTKAAFSLASLLIGISKKSKKKNKKNFTEREQTSCQHQQNVKIFPNSKKTRKAKQ